MLKTPDMNSLLDLFRAASNEDRLQHALDITTRMLGFTQFAMGHHVDLLRPPDDAIRLSTYNEDWVSYGLERGYFSDDPIHAASTKTVIGFRSCPTGWCRSRRSAAGSDPGQAARAGRLTAGLWLREPRVSSVM